MYDNEKKTLIEACKRMYNNGLTVGSWGNISMRISDDRIIITPSGSNYMKMNIEDIVVMDLNGNKIEGRLNPSSERLMHYQIYRKRNNVNAIVHTHSIYSSVISVINKDIPPITEDIVMILGKNVKVAKYALTGTMELANNVVEALGANNAAIMANHGAVSVGSDMERAITAAEVLEKSSRIMVYTMNFKYSTIPDDDIYKLLNISSGYLNQWKNWK